MRHIIVAVLTALVARAAAAVPVCAASDIVGVDPGCPAQGTCTITRDIEVSGPCTLDFGTRPVFLDKNRAITLLPNVVCCLSTDLTINAGSFTMLPGSFIGGHGEYLHVATTGDVVLRRIDLSGDSGGGAGITAGGSVHLQESFIARALLGQGNGGGLGISAAGDLVAAPGAVIDLRGGNADNGRGGSTAFYSAGKVDLGDVIDVRGGGGVAIDAGGDIVLRGVHGDASPSNERIPGGVSLQSRGNVRVVDALSLRGASGPVDGTGSYGGSLSIKARGNLSIEAPIVLDGGFPENAPGELSFFVGGAISVAAGGPISARSRGATEDGSISMTAGTTITIAGRIDASGGDTAVPVTIEAEGDITLAAPIDARAFPLGPDTSDFDYPYGGEIVVTSHSGSLVVAAPLYTVPQFDPGGGIELTGRDVTVASTALLTTGEESPGSIVVTACGQLRIDGRLTTEVHRPFDPFGIILEFDPGEIILEFPANRPPLFGADSEMHPAPELDGYADLGPCFRCGDGKVDGNEECDDGNLIDCDGCDSNCRLSDTCPLPTPTPSATPAPTLAAPGIVCAGDLGSTDLGCPAQGACTLTHDVAITGSCTLDAETRPFSVGAARTIHIAPGGDLTVKAGSFTMQPGAFIDGRGPANAAEVGRGASLTVIAAGDVVLQRSGVTQARIDVSAASFPGRIDIRSGGSVDIAGPLTAKSSATRADANGFGGFVGIEAADSVNLENLIDVSNADGGGTIIIAAGSDVVVKGLRGNGGGSVDIAAGGNVQILDAINLLGSPPGAMQPSPFGGILYIRAPGDISIEAPINVDGTSAGGEGHIAIAAGGSINVAAGAHLFARGFGDFVPDEYGDIDPFMVLGGGAIDLRAGSTITTAARIDASADSRGGQVGMYAGGDITVHAPVDVTGYHGQGYAGQIEMVAGQGQDGGALLIDQALYADGGRFPQPLAGSIDLQGCEVMVTAGGLLSSRAPGNGGSISINARASLHIDGFVTAKAITSGATEIQDGVIWFVVPEGRPPAVGAHGSVLPAAEIQVADGCDSTCRMSNTCPPATLTPTLTPTPTDVAEGSATVTPTVTLIASETGSPTPTPPLIACAGDCDASGEVTIDELTRGVSIALGADPVSACPAFDMDGNAEITIDELIQGLNNALNGCVPSAG